MPPAAAAAAQTQPRAAMKPAFRPTTIPVLPLSYNVKKKQITPSITTPTVNIRRAVSKNENSKPFATSSLSHVSYVNSTKENEFLSTKDKKETATIVTSPLQETNGNNQGTKLKVEEAEKSGDEQIKGKSQISSLVCKS